jgi:phosphoribosylformylglycinamidine cyclo-ligase
VIDAATWTPPAVFGWLAATGNIVADEMLRVFNCGIGMVLVVAAADVEATLAMLAAAGDTATRIGVLEAGSGPAGLRIDGLAAGWPR